ncbi:uncharacterized protein Tco025E_06663 [Trypanosoma conorhini]|uniref:Uncharacterized protein n=1 Tax=Trypanosoma conorhini TaxID=83891 RepID=A0A3R7LC13_9TRYP|nr:uncharacterized protein Tco025E_06663 [Trypanosoma conorhini]RNF11369.1 hypothetical protein Tco025E_06663 [Trypanosoma conorhini]
MSALSVVVAVLFLLTVAAAGLLVRRCLVQERRGASLRDPTVEAQPRQRAAPANAHDPRGGASSSDEEEAALVPRHRFVATGAVVRPCGGVVPRLPRPALTPASPSPTGDTPRTPLGTPQPYLPRDEGGASPHGEASFASFSRPLTPESEAAADAGRWPRSEVNRAVEQNEAAAAAPTRNGAPGTHDVCAGGGGYRGEGARGGGPPQPLAQRRCTPDAGGTGHFTCGADAAMSGRSTETTPTSSAGAESDGTPHMPPIGASVATAAPGTSGVLFLSATTSCGDAAPLELVSPAVAAVAVDTPLAAVSLAPASVGVPGAAGNSNLGASMDT